MKLIILPLTMVMLATISIVLVVKENVSTREEVNTAFHDRQMFEQGFFAGAQAAIKVITMETNADMRMYSVIVPVGQAQPIYSNPPKLALELTNLLNELYRLEHDNGTNNGGSSGATNRGNRQAPKAPVAGRGVR